MGLRLFCRTSYGDDIAAVLALAPVLTREPFPICVTLPLKWFFHVSYPHSIFINV